MKKQRDKEDFCDKYKGVSIDFSSNKSSSNEYSFKEERLMIKDGKRDNIQERLEKDNRVQLEPKKQNFRLTWKKNIDRYL